MVRAIRFPLLISALLSAACGVSAPAPAPGGAPSGATPPTTAATSPLDLKIAQFAPVDIGANVAALPANEQQAVSHMVKAARIMDGLFLQQVWAGNPSLLVQLGADRTPQGQAELHYFLINKGPWARTDHNAVFVRPDLGVPAKPEQANFYPDDATKDEVDKWISSLTGTSSVTSPGFTRALRSLSMRA